MCTFDAMTENMYILAEVARLRRASTAMRTVNDIPTLCTVLLYCCGAVEKEVCILSL